MHWLLITGLLSADSKLVLLVYCCNIGTVPVLLFFISALRMTLIQSDHSVWANCCLLTYNRPFHVFIWVWCFLFCWPSDYFSFLHPLRVTVTAALFVDVSSCIWWISALSCPAAVVISAAKVTDDSLFVFLHGSKFSCKLNTTSHDEQTLSRSDSWTHTNISTSTLCWNFEVSERIVQLNI